MQHLTSCVSVKKYAASQGKESRRLSVTILVYLHTQNAHFCPLCSGVGGSRLPKLRALLKGSRMLEVCVKSMLSRSDSSSLSLFCLVHSLYVLTILH